MMRATCDQFRVLILSVLWVGTASTACGQLWKPFLPTARVDADPRADYRLTEKNGPWLIMAATFSGDGAEQQARDLVLEFRQRYNLAAYLHNMAFNFSDDSSGEEQASNRGSAIGAFPAEDESGGRESYGAPSRRRYRREGEMQYAVLVGDYPAIDDPDAQQTLRRVKRLQPEALRVEEGGRTAQTLVKVRAFQDAILARAGIDRMRGPMGQAFLARNPLLPREYFVPKGVDKFVERMNKGVEHSLLDSPGKYTVRVGTFRGRSVLQTSALGGQSWDSPHGRKNDHEEALVEAAENAHLLTEELRAHGWEAYEFHDRTESIVTIGSFDEVAARLPDGRTVAVPAVQRIIETFGAAYNTPADPLNDIGNDAKTQQDIDRREREVSRQLGMQVQTVSGLNPKHVKINRRRRGKLVTERIIPIDIYPQAMEAPKRSISSAYVR